MLNPTKQVLRRTPVKSPKISGFFIEVKRLNKLSISGIIFRRMSDFVTFPGTSPLFEVDPEMFDRIARVTPATHGRILINRSFELVATERYRAVNPELVVRQFRPLITACMEHLDGDLLEFDYDRRPALPDRVQRSRQWHFDAKASALMIGQETDEAVKNAIVGMTALPTLTAVGELPETHELISVLNTRPRYSRSVIQATAQRAIDRGHLMVEPAKVGWASLLPGDTMHKGNPNPTSEPILRRFFRLKEV